MTGFLGQGPLNLQYRFDEDYVDLCHANNPNCVSGVTCDNCNDGYNPHLIVASYLITRGDAPLDGSVTVGNTAAESPVSGVEIFPNPGDGLFIIRFLPPSPTPWQGRLLNRLGQELQRFVWLQAAGHHTMDIRHLPAGVYFLQVTGVGTPQTHRLVIQ
jgi:hypothetical protein